MPESYLGYILMPDIKREGSRRLVRHAELVRVVFNGNSAVCDGINVIAKRDVHMPDDYD